MFWARVKPDLFTGCWEWMGPKTSFGHGTSARIDGERVAHRLSWLLTYGPIPEGGWVLHHCDNPPCVNPQHLYVGTLWENARDRTVRGRGGHHKCAGENHPNSKLTIEAVRAIRARYTATRGEQIALAREYGVSDQTIRRIVRARAWRYV